MMNNWKLDEDSVSCIQLRTVPFEADDLICWKIRLQTVSNGIASIDFKANNYTSAFAAKLLPLYVYDINRMEGTICGQNEGATMLKIRSYFEAGCKIPDLVQWNAEGGREATTESSDRQLYQCAQAVKFLLVDNSNSALTLDLIVRTHEIMMENSFSVDRYGCTLTDVGSVRTTKEINAGMYQFVTSASVLSSTKHLVKQYNEASGIHPVELATYLFYELITIHPFVNGNGRLCRLFLAWSLIKDGFPFPASFSSGHSKRRQHYLHAINTARRPFGAGSRGELNVILLLTLERVMGNYEENLRIMREAEEGETCTKTVV